MDEQKDKQEKKEPEAKPAEDSGDGDKSKTISELDRADSIVERQKRENDRREKLLEREEDLHARKIVGGETEAGSVKVEVPEAQKKVNDAAEYFKGTQLEKDIKKANE